MNWPMTMPPNPRNTFIQSISPDRSAATRVALDFIGV